MTKIQMTKTLPMGSSTIVLNFEHSDFDIFSARPGATWFVSYTSVVIDPV
jgi:hypothetical protein